MVPQYGNLAEVINQSIKAEHEVNSKCLIKPYVIIENFQYLARWGASVGHNDLE